LKTLVRGAGINDRSCPTSIDGIILREYTLWTNMLDRVYSTKYHKVCPTYIGCSVSDNFKSYSYFFKWCQVQLGFGSNNYQLDKDLLCKGNKEYTEYSCVFIHREINLMLRTNKVSRGGLPIGVTKKRSKFSANCRANGARVVLGSFDTPELAFNAYKTFKEAHIKELAEKYKENIDPRAYFALLNYEVHIDD